MLNMHLHESHLQTYDFLLIKSSTAVHILVTRYILRIDYTTDQDQDQFHQSWKLIGN